MRQRAVVLETDGKIAKIAVSRATMCEGCHKNGGCGSGHCEITGLLENSGKFESVAENRAGALAGDTVEVETDSNLVLGYAALVFIMPVAACLIFYAAAERIFGTEGAGLVGAVIGFVLSFVLCVIIDRSRRRKTPDIKIVSVLRKGGIVSSEIENN